MKKEELKDRLDKADDRIIALFKRYPVVFSIMVVVPFVVGLVVGKWGL